MLSEHQKHVQARQGRYRFRCGSSPPTPQPLGKEGVQLHQHLGGGSDLKPCTDAGFLYNPYGAPSGTDSCILSDVQALLTLKRSDPTIGLLLLIPDPAVNSCWKEIGGTGGAVALEHYPKSEPGPLLSLATGKPLDLDHDLHVIWVPPSTSKAHPRGQSKRRKCGSCPNCLHPTWKKACTGNTEPVHQAPHQTPSPEESVMEEIETYGQYTNSVGEDAKLSDISEFMKRVSTECHRDPATQLLISQCKANPEEMTQRGLQMIGEHLWRFSLGWFQHYIPDCHSLKQQVLLESHTAASGGHGGWHSTYEKVSRRAYWRGLQTDVQTFVAECAVCQTTKVRRKKPFGLLHPVPVPVRGSSADCDF